MNFLRFIPYVRFFVNIFEPIHLARLFRDMSQCHPFVLAILRRGSTQLRSANTHMERQGRGGLMAVNINRRMKRINYVLCCVKTIAVQYCTGLMIVIRRDCDMIFMCYCSGISYWQPSAKMDRKIVVWLFSLQNVRLERVIDSTGNQSWRLSWNVDWRCRPCWSGQLRCRFE